MVELGALQPKERAPLRTEAELTFMLARPALTRWQFETERLRQLARNRSPAKRGLALMESELGLAQIKALADRIQPLTNSQNMAVRFEAQETLVALDTVGDRLGSILDEARADLPRREVDEINAAVFAPAQLRPAPPAAAGGRGHFASAAFREGGDTPQRQAARFEARYINHLIGRTLDRATASATVSPLPADDDAAFEQAVRETAYLLWEQDGRPEGRADEYWQRAVEKQRNQRSRDKADREAAGDLPHQSTELASLVQTADQEADDAFAELAATLGSLCEEPEAPQAGAIESIGSGERFASPITSGR